MRNVLFLLGLAGCGGVITSPSDAGVDAAADVATEASSDGAALVACANACIAQTNGSCPALLLYDCLNAPCGANASTSICAMGDETPTPATITCVQAALPACPTACQQDATCKAFVACIEACH